MLHHKKKRIAPCMLFLITEQNYSRFPSLHPFEEVKQKKFVSNLLPCYVLIN